MANDAPHRRNDTPARLLDAVGRAWRAHPIGWAFALFILVFAIGAAAAHAIEIRDVKPQRPKPLAPEAPPAGWVPPPVEVAGDPALDPISTGRVGAPPAPELVAPAPPAAAPARPAPKIVTEPVVVDEIVEPLQLTPEMVAVPLGTVAREAADAAQSRPEPIAPAAPASVPRAAPERPRRLVQADRPLAHIEEIWFAALPRMQAGDVGAATATVERLRSLMDDAGIAGLPVHAMAMLHLVRQYEDRGDLLGARALARAATELDPTSGAPWMDFARTSLRGPDRSAGDVLDATVGWFASLGRSRARQAAALGNLTFYALAATILLGAFMFIRPAARGFLILNHRLGQALPENVPAWLRTAGLAFVIVAPLVFPGGLGWFFFVVLALVAPYLWQRERRRLALGVASMAAAGPLVAFCASFDAYLVDPGLQVISEASESVVTPQSLERATRALETNGEDPALWGAKAQFLKLAGDLEGAANAYRHAIALATETTYLLNNYGNIALAAGQDGLAGKLYRKAARGDPGSAAVQFNLGQYHRSLMEFNEGEAAFRRARRIDPELVGSAVVRVTADERHNTVDLPIDAGTWWRRFFQPSPTRAHLEHALWSRFFPYMPLWLAPVVALAGTIALAGRRRRPPREVTGICARCGVVASIPYHEGEEEAGACPSCRSLADHPKELAPELRRRQLERIERFQGLRRNLVRWAAAVLPGAGHWLVGKRWRGGAMVAVFFVLLVKWLAWAGRFDYSHWPSAGPSAPALALFALVTATLYWLSIRTLPKL